MIDFGTATTFDVIAADGAIEGGVIAPGINLSVEALYMASRAVAAHCHRAAEAAWSARRPCPPCSPASTGAMSAMIEGMVGRIKAETGWPMTVIATGGLAPLFRRGATN